MRVLIVNAVPHVVKRLLPEWKVIDLVQAVGDSGMMIDVPRLIPLIHNVMKKEDNAVFVLNMSMIRENMDALRWIILADVIAIDRPCGLWIVKSRVPSVPTTSPEILLTWDSFVEGLRETKGGDRL